MSLVAGEDRICLLLLSASKRIWEAIMNQQVIPVGLQLDEQINDANVARQRCGCGSCIGELTLFDLTEGFTD